MQPYKNSRFAPFIAPGADAQALAETLRTLADMLQSGELLVDTGRLVVRPKIIHPEGTTRRGKLGVMVSSTLVLSPR